MKRNEIGTRLVILRDIRRASQLDLGRAANLSKDMVCKIENGTRELSFYEMVAFAQFLCISLDAFYRTGDDGVWDISACLLPYTAPVKEPKGMLPDPAADATAPIP